MGDGMSKATATGHPCLPIEGAARLLQAKQLCSGPGCAEVKSSEQALGCCMHEEDVPHLAPLCPQALPKGAAPAPAAPEGLVSTPVLRTVSSDKEETLIIFDWDDTLLCSSAINASQWSMSELKALERAVASVLEASMELGDTMIVTNGNASWVRDSAHRFLPGLVPTLERMTVMSARAMFEHMYPGDPFSWKRQAFRQILKCRREQCTYGPDGVNLIVLGDSAAEMEAAHIGVKVYAGASLVKTVKFREAPTLMQLMGQIHTVSQELADIVRATRSMSKELEQIRLPAHLSHLVAEASGWKISVGRDWRSSHTFLNALFSKDFDEDIPPIDLPDWMVQLANRMATWRTDEAPQQRY